MWIHEIIKYLQALLESSAFFIRQIYDSNDQGLLIAIGYDQTRKMNCNISLIIESIIL